MFGPSLKSVPGCLVSIVPTLIGEPVALTPGFGPHDEVLVEELLELGLAVAVFELELAPAEPPVPGALLVVPLLPQPATMTAPMSATNASSAGTLRARS